MWILLLSEHLGRLVMSPFANDHNCIINEDTVSISKVMLVKTKFGKLRLVMGTTNDGRQVPRALRIPATIPIMYAHELCQAYQGKLHPATPAEPQKQFMTAGVFYYNDLCKEAQIDILNNLVKDFDAPFCDEEIILSSWSESFVNSLPDSSFLIVTKGENKQRYLPYRDEKGKIDSDRVKRAISRVHKLEVSAYLKRKGLNKLLRIAKALGVEVKEKKYFKLSDLDFYLNLLEKLE